MGTKKRVKRKPAAEREWEVLFPFQEVALQSGRKVVVRQWDIETGSVLTARVVKMMERLREEGVSGGANGEIEIGQILQVALAECVGIVAETIGWTEEQLNERASMDDFYDLLQAVIDTSLVRPDGGGALGKIVGLAGVLAPLAGLQPPPPSTSSSEPATRSQTSGG